MRFRSYPRCVHGSLRRAVPVSLDPEHDAMLALERWVEEGVAPDMLIATTDQPLTTHAAENPTQPAAFTRPLCPYPEEANYKGAGDPTNAANFVCAVSDNDHAIR